MIVCPRNLEQLAGAQDTLGLNLELVELGLVLNQSLFARSSPLPLKISLVKWNKDICIQHLCGRTVKFSQVGDFVDKLTSSSLDSRANHFPQLVKEMRQMIQDTYSPMLSKESKECSQTSCSSKTLKESCPPKCQEENQSLFMF